MGNVRRALAMLALATSAAAGAANAPAPPAQDEEDPPSPFEACRGEGEDRVFLIDAASRRLHETVCGATLWFDGLFGERDLESARGSYGRFELSTQRSEFEGEAVRVRFDARVELPALSRRTLAFIGRDNEDEVAQDRAEGLGLRSQAEELDQDEHWFAGLGYRIRETWGIRSEFRAGVRDVSEPTAFVQLRNSWTAYEDANDRIQLRLTPFVNTRDHHGVTGATDFDHALSPTRLLRWGSIATVAEENSGMQWRSAVILYQNLQRLRAVAFEAFERGLTTAPEPLIEYGARIIYRQPFFGGRLFGDLVVGYSWPRVDPALPREGSAGITAGLELPFGARAVPAAVPAAVPEPAR